MEGSELVSPLSPWEPLLEVSLCPLRKEQVPREGALPKSTELLLSWDLGRHLGKCVSA